MEFVTLIRVTHLISFPWQTGIVCSCFAGTLAAHYKIKAPSTSEDDHVYTNIKIIRSIAAQLISVLSFSNADAILEQTLS